MGWCSFWGLRSECCGALPHDEPSSSFSLPTPQKTPNLPHSNSNDSESVVARLCAPVSRSSSDSHPVAESVNLSAVLDSASPMKPQSRRASSLENASSTPSASARNTMDTAQQRVALFKAVQAGSAEQLHTLFTNPNVNPSSLLLTQSDANEFRTAVDFVISSAGNEIAETPLAAWYLKSEGKTEGYLTPLHVAARQGHAEAITRILRVMDTASEPYNAGMVNSYCNKTTSANEGLTPLHLAMYAPAKPSSQRPTEEVDGTGARKVLQDLMSLNNLVGDRHGCIEVLVAHGSRVDAQAEIPGLVKCRGTALHMAAVNFCDAEAMRLLLAAGADVNATIISDDPTLHGSTVLHLTLRIGLLYDDSNIRNALPLLIQKGADPWMEGPEGNAMHVAAKYGTGMLGAEVLRKLVAAMVMVAMGQLGPGTPPHPPPQQAIHQPQIPGKNGLPSLFPRLNRTSRARPTTNSEAINTPNLRGETPLQLAACNPDGGAEVVMEVMDLGADLRCTAAAAALMAAMDSVVDDLSKVKAMLERGVDTTKLLEVQDSRVGPLNPVQWMFLAAAGQVRTNIPDRAMLLEVLKLALEYNTRLPDIPVGASCFESPMLYALRRFDLQFLGFVIVAGEDLNDCAEVAADGTRRQHSPVIAILERDDLPDKDGLVRLLIQAGADPAKRSQLRHGACALHMLRNGMEGMVQVLTQAGVDVNQPDDNMDTPLSLVVQRGDVFIARMLMMQAAAVTTINRQARSPLHLLCRNPCPPEHISMARSLLKAGADPAAPDADGFSALDYAKQSGDEELIQLMQKYCQLREAQAARNLDKASGNLSAAAPVPVASATAVLPQNSGSLKGGNSQQKLRAKEIIPPVKRPSSSSLRPPSLFDSTQAAAVVAGRAGKF